MVHPRETQLSHPTGEPDDHPWATGLDTHRHTPVLLVTAHAQYQKSDSIFQTACPGSSLQTASFVSTSMRFVHQLEASTHVHNFRQDVIAPQIASASHVQFDVSALATLVSSTLCHTRDFPQPSLSAAARLGLPAQASENLADCALQWSWSPRPDELTVHGSVGRAMHGLVQTRVGFFSVCHFHFFSIFAHCSSRWVCPIRICFVKS